jgi:hypothetical protein
MGLIRDIVKQALDTGYLTLEAEDRLRVMLKREYSAEDLNAFMLLQNAAMDGAVRQQSRELILASVKAS